MTKTQIKGRKRHLIVDNLGLMVMMVKSANISNQQGDRLIFERLAAMSEQIARLILIWVDGTYEGIDFMKWVMDIYDWILETSGNKC